MMLSYIILLTGIYFIARYFYDMSVTTFLSGIITAFLLFILIGIVCGFLLKRIIINRRNIHLEQLVDIVAINVGEMDRANINTNRLVFNGLIFLAGIGGLTSKNNTDEMLKNMEPVITKQDGICGVCYDTLDGELLACPKCHKAAHTQCLKEWLDSKQDMCIYCRHSLGAIQP